MSGPRESDGAPFEVKWGCVTSIGARNGFAVLGRGMNIGPSTRSASLPTWRFPRRAAARLAAFRPKRISRAELDQVRDRLAGMNRGEMQRLFEQHRDAELAR